MDFSADMAAVFASLQADASPAAAAAASPRRQLPMTEHTQYAFRISALIVGRQECAPAPATGTAALAGATFIAVLNVPIAFRCVSGWLNVANLCYGAFKRAFAWLQLPGYIATVALHAPAAARHAFSTFLKTSPVFASITGTLAQLCQLTLGR